MINKIKALVAVGCLALAPAAFAVPFSVSVDFNGGGCQWYSPCWSDGGWTLGNLGYATGGEFDLDDGESYVAHRDVAAGTYLWTLFGGGRDGVTSWYVYWNGQQVDSGTATGGKIIKSYAFADGGLVSVPEPGTLALLGLGLLGIGFSVRRRQPEA